MKKIKIYLVAKENSLKEDEKELSNFIRDLNERYEKENIYFKLLTDNDDLEEEIKTSELFFILFSKEIDAITMKKFHLAYTNFKEKKNPKISTYIKNIEKPNQSVLDFMKKLDEELGHYYSVYENIDTIKLNLILRLKSLDLSLGEIEVKDDTLYIDEEEVISLENIEMFMSNKDLNKLKKESQELEIEYWNLREKIREEDSDDIFNEFVEVKTRREKIKETIHELEKNMIDLESSFIKLSSEGNLSQRQIYAKKCLEQGNIREAKKVLNLEDIKKEANQILELQDRRKEELQIKVNELKQRIDTLAIDIENKNRFKEIEEAYEEVIRIEKEGGLYRKSMADYCDYLYDQNKLKKVIEIGNKFLSYVQADDITPVEEISNIYNLFGAIYYLQNNFILAEEYYKKDIEFIIKYTSKEEKKWQDYLAVSYNNIGLLYSNMKRDKDAEEAYQKAIEIRKKLEKDNEIAILYNNIAQFYFDHEKYDEAQKYYQKAVEIIEELMQKKREKYNDCLSFVYNNEGLLYSKIKKPEKALEYYQKSIKIREKLVKENPEAYSQDLANVYNNISVLYQEIEEYKKALKYYQKAIEIYEYLKCENTEVYSEKLANVYNNIAYLYRITKKYQESLKYNEKSIAIRIILVKENPEVYQESLAISYNNMGILYADMNQYEKAEEYYKKAIEIRKKLDVYSHNLALVYHNLSILYEENKKYDEALNYYQKVVQIREVLFKKNKEAYRESLIKAYHNITDLYIDMNMMDKADEYEEKIKELEKDTLK